MFQLTQPRHMQDTDGMFPMLNVQCTAIRNYCTLIWSNWLITAVAYVSDVLTSKWRAWFTGFDVLYVEHISENVKGLITSLRNCHRKLQSNYHPKIYCIIQSSFWSQIRNHTLTHTHTPWGISTRHGNQEDLALCYSMLPTKEIAS